MMDLLSNEPWLLVIILAAGVIVSCVAIVFVTDYLRKSSQAEIDAALKQEMLSRGMSAADIKTVLESTGAGEALHAARASQPVRVGLGKFRVEVGAVDRPLPPGAESPAAHG